MLLLILFFLWAGESVALTLAQPWMSPSIAQRQVAATAPSQDPFYSPPPGFETSEVGSILRSTPPPTPLSFLGIAHLNVKATYQIQYRTTDNDGNPAVAVTTLVIPNNADFGKLLAYEIAIDATSIDCSPSYTLQQLPDPRTVISQTEFISIEAALNRGWCVTIPDFLEPISAFVARRLTAYAVLDSIRATLKSSSFSGVSTDAKITLWGYSGGGIASGVATELQASYAPELKIAGSVLGGPSPNVENVFGLINKGIFAGVIVDGLWGLANAYPKFAQTIEDHLRPATAAKFKNARANGCPIQFLLGFPGEDILSYFDENIWQEPYISQILDDNNMGHLAPSPLIPIYVYQSINNELSPVHDTDVLVDTYCTAGSNVEYVRDLVSEHLSLVATGAPSAILWLQDRFDGVPVTPGCTTRNVTSTLASPQAIEVFGQDIIQTLLDLLGKPIGPASLA